MYFTYTWRAWEWEGVQHCDTDEVKTTNAESICSTLSPYTNPPGGRKGMQRACRRVHAIAVGPIHTVSQHAKQIVHTSAAVRRKVKRTHVRIGSKVLHDGGNSIELFLDELGRGTVAVVPEIVLDIDIFATQSTGTFKL